jgi:hypothetical protein
MHAARKPGLGRHWEPPAYFEQLQSEGEAECVIELIRCFARSASTRLCLLSDPRVRCDRQTVAIELPRLRDSCRQVGADTAASICQQIVAQDPRMETAISQLFLDALRREVWAVIHDMHSYAAGLKSELLESGNRSASCSRPMRDTALTGRSRVMDLSKDSIPRGEMRSDVSKRYFPVIRKI